MNVHKGAGSLENKTILANMDLPNGKSDPEIYKNDAEKIFKFLNESIPSMTYDLLFEMMKGEE